LGRDGFLGPVPIDETTPTWSGPCWATIATGCGVDFVGHAVGAGAAYREAAQAADQRVGRLLAAVGARPSVTREAWTTVVVTHQRC
jgi:hypothetical protein